MAFDSDTRNKLARMVTQGRQLLTDEFTHQLQEIYGIQPDGAIVDVEKLTHLDDEEAGIAKFLRERIGHLVSGMTTEKKPVVAAIDRAVREQAFTILNRFAALRMCEERSLVEECVRAEMQSKGFKVYETIAGSGLGDTYERYKTFLFCLFDEIAVDLGILFDRFSPHGLLFPREQALLGLINIINNDDLSRVWAEDETIGWTYQYFNSKEEREAMRKASAAPRNSRELAVRNQFFTPRYVVEFLTDNTLGRIWYEMRKGDTCLKEECLYLVRRPKEAFLALGKKAPAEPEKETDLPQEELLKKSFYIEHRFKKDPRDLRVLDPACGSGHFLLYAFDLLERIYQEAWDDPESPKSEITGKTLRDEFETLTELRRAIPKLIIEHNLHGIDIEPRAVQIAALALWLRAQKTWKTLGIKPAERPRIQRSNIVTAEPMPGEEDMRSEFTESLRPKVLGQLVKVVFDKMKLAGEAGSLLKIEEEINDAAAEAKKQWLEGPKMEQVVLIPEMVKPKPKQEQLRFDLTGVTDKRFWEKAEDHILDALKEYAERAENGHATRRWLFADDAARGFAFIDLGRKRYDVVLMNPPFGKATSVCEQYLRKSFPESWKELYACFAERAYSILQVQGMLGAITSSLFLYSKQLRGYRLALIEYPLLEVLVDLGGGVLDSATVDTALTIQRQHRDDTALFLDLTSAEDKGCELLEATHNKQLRYVVRILSDFRLLRNWPLCYYLPPALLRLWKPARTFEPELAEVVAGNHTFDDERFVRLRPEVPVNCLNTKWIPYEKGGSYQRFFAPTDLVVDWEGDGREMRENQVARYGTDAQVMQSVSWWHKPGLTYPRISSIGFSPKVLPAGHMFSEKGMCVFPHDMDDANAILAVLSSTWCEEMLMAFGRHRAYENTAIANLPLFRERIHKKATNLADLAAQCVKLMSEAEIVHETSAVFQIPAVVMKAGEQQKISGCLKKHLDVIREALARAYVSIDDAVSSLLSIKNKVTEFMSELRIVLLRRIDVLQGGKPREDVLDILQYSVGCIVGRWDIRFGIGEQQPPELPDPFAPLPVCSPGMLQGPDDLPAKPETVPLDYPLRINWDGIIVDDPEHDDDIVRRVREVLDPLWKDKTHEIEQEACDILGVSDLRDYFRRPSRFFQDHLKRYSKSRRKAPIYWQLSTKSGSYTLWIYYHRLTDQTLYACVNDYVNPKLDDIAKDVERLQEQVSKQSTAQSRQKLEQLMDVERELKDFRDELLRVAGLPYRPNLNDGVMITASPLWRLFRHTQWRKDLEKCWKKLEVGDYAWAHLAYAIWPDRVKKKCRTDISIAIAHDLEDLYEGDDTKPKRRREKGKD